MIEKNGALWDARKMEEYAGLWKRAFGDTDQYIRYYFSGKAKKSIIYENRTGEELASMAFFTPYAAYYRGERRTLAYIVGVATEEKYRRQGRMRKTLTAGIDAQKKAGAPIVFLCPENPSVYEPLGFIDTYWRKTTIVTGYGGAPAELTAIPWQDLSGRQKESAAAFAGKMLAAESFDLYLEHSVNYYEEVNREMQALDGEVLTLWRGKNAVAVADRIWEDGHHEIEELIASREMAESVIRTLAGRLKSDRLVIVDSYFISHLEGDGICQKIQDKPYIMIKNTDGSPAAPVSCYINDLT